MKHILRACALAALLVMAVDAPAHAQEASLVSLSVPAETLPSIIEPQVEMKHFDRVVVCDSPFRIRQIAAAVSSMSPKHKENRTYAFETAVNREQQSYCHWETNIDYVVLAENNFTYNVTVPYYEAVSSSSSDTKADGSEGTGHVYLITKLSYK